VALLQRMLESNGYRVTGFSSSEEALACFQQSPNAFDAIITDQTMPRMSGLELASAVHAARPGIPVVLTTGYVDRTALRDLTRDIAGVGAKPFDAENPMAVIFKHAKEPVPRLPEALSDLQHIIDRLLAKNPADRYANAELVANIIGDIRDAMPDCELAA